MSSWTDYTPWGAAYNGAQYATGTGDYDPTKAARAGLSTNGRYADNFARQGMTNYGQANEQLGQDNTFLRGLASGQNSISAEQLRQGLQQNLASQQSMAAGAAPQNQAMAARNAAMNMGQAAYGMSGQQALAGLQERQNAMQQLGANLNNQAQMGVAAANGGLGNANNAYAPQIQNPQKSVGQAVFNAAQSAGGAAAMFSDKRLKHDIADGDADARKLREGLKAYTYKYNDPGHGEGKRIGILAQDLQAAGSRSVFETGKGKAVNGAVLSTENTAMIATLGEDVKQLRAGLAAYAKNAQAAR